MAATAVSQLFEVPEGVLLSTNVGKSEAAPEPVASAELCRLLTASILRAIHDGLVGGDTEVRKRDQPAFLPTPWGRAHVWMFGHKVGRWDPAYRLQFTRALRDDPQQVWAHVEGIVAGGCGAKRVPPLVAYFMPQGGRELRRFVIDRVQEFLVRHKLATTRDALADQHLQLVHQHLDSNGVTPSAVRVTTKGLDLSLDELCNAAGVPSATIRRYGDTRRLMEKAYALARSSHWSNGNLRFVAAGYRSKGKDYTPGVLFDFGHMGVKRGGLLDQLLDLLPAPADYAQVGVLRRAMERAVASPPPGLGGVSGAAIRRTLSTPIDQLSDAEVDKVVQRVRFDAQQAGCSPRTLEGYIEIIRAQLTGVLAPRGRVLPKHRRDISARAPRPGRGLVSDMPDAAAPEAMRPGIVHVVTRSSTEALSTAREHIANRLERIEAACNLEIEQFITWRTWLNAAIATPPSDERLRFRHALFAKALTKTTPVYEWLREGDLIQVVAAAAEIAEHHQLHTFRGELSRREQARHVLLGPASARILALLPDVAAWWGKHRRGHPQTSVVMSRWFVPRSVQLVLELKIQIATGWNREPVRALKAAGIRMDGSTVDLQSVKGKTGELQSKVIEGADRQLRSGLSLMLAQDETLRGWPRETDSIFCAVGCFKRKGLVVSKQCDYKLLPAFQQRHALPAFTSEQLRNQKGTHVYLRAEDPHEAQASLGHASLETTSSYIRHRVTGILNEANIARFRRQLAATIVWVDGGNDALASRNLDASDVAPNLLYPLGLPKAPADLPADCDVWLTDPSAPLVIDRARIKHLMRQRRYYAENWQRLRATRPDEFARVHLPRIEFTSALWAVVLDSPLGSLLEVEE